MSTSITAPCSSSSPAACRSSSAPTSECVATYATELRRQAGEKTVVWSITNFDDLPVFQETIAYPLVLVAPAGVPS